MFNRNSRRYILALLVLSLVFFIACSPGIRAQKNPEKPKNAKVITAKNPQVKNVIVLIGDGMGNQQRRIAGIVEGDGDANHRLVCENLTTSGVAFNHSLNALVTDSAASGTALASGYKTMNGMISMVPDKNARDRKKAAKPVRTILEACRDLGKSTGLITTVTITHATPAVYGAHSPSRKLSRKIAAAYYENKIDLLMGGGWEDFLPLKPRGGMELTKEEKRNLLEDFKKDGYAYVTDRNQLLKLNAGKTTKVLGLFSKGAMAYEADRNKEREPSIAEMTSTAIKVLSKNQEGFFLMVEGGKIDWANHGHDVAGSVYDTIAFDRAVKVAVDFAGKDGKTLIVVVNDHETGGMTITANVNVTQIRNLKAGAEKMARLIKKDGSNIDQIFAKYAGIKELTDRERKMVLDEANGRLNVMDEWGYGGTIISEILSRRTGIHFATGGHSGTPVIIAAFGPGCRIFDGFYDQTEIPQKIGKLLGIKFP